MVKYGALLFSKMKQAESFVWAVHDPVAGKAGGVMYTLTVAQPVVTASARTVNELYSCHDVNKPFRLNLTTH